VNLAPETLEPRRPPDCLSELALERLRQGELGEREAAARAHLGGCARCAAIAAELAAASREFPPRRTPEARVGAFPPRAQRRRPRLLWGASAAFAALAAVVVIRIAAPTDGTRLKGAARLGFYVKHGDDVRLGISGERAVPGDALRFTITAPAPAWLLILSRDGRGAASVYYPTTGAMARIEAGRDVPLAASTVLDDVPGHERICAVLCPGPHPVAALRAAFEAGAPAPSDCAEDCVSIEKAASPP
jgi:hypothetical protein